MYVYVFICIFLYIQIYIFEEKRILVFCSDHILYTTEEKIGRIPAKKFLPDKTLKDRLCECTSSFHLTALKEH